MPTRACPACRAESTGTFTAQTAAMSSSILVTGGAGFIGSHTCVALATAGYAPVILDNLCNSDVRVLDRLTRIIGTTPRFVEGDVRDRELLDKLFREHAIG